MPSNTSEYFPRPECMGVCQWAVSRDIRVHRARRGTDRSFEPPRSCPVGPNLQSLDVSYCCSKEIKSVSQLSSSGRSHNGRKGRGGKKAGLTDVDAVVVPVRPGHVLVDVGVNPRHLCWCYRAREVAPLTSAKRKWVKERMLLRSGGLSTLSSRIRRERLGGDANQGGMSLS